MGAKNLVRAVVLGVILGGMVSMLAACGGSPTGPTQNTCQDSAATNFGGPLPCTYKTAITFVTAIPGDGQKVTGNTVDVTAHYQLAQENQGVRLLGYATLSNDGVTDLPGGFGGEQIYDGGGIKTPLTGDIHITINITNPAYTSSKFINLVIKETDFSGTILASASQQWALSR